LTWRDHLPTVRGKLLIDEPMAPFTWFRVGGPADVIFLPEDEADLAAFLKALDPAVPVIPIGVGSNTLVRDGGVEGVVIRLGKAFGRIEARGDNRIYAGAAALDAMVAREAAKAGIAGLEFYRGVPGSIGGATVMNAGCYGAETKDVLVEAYAIDRQGEAHTFTNAEMDFSYRKSAKAASGGLIFTGALFEGTADDPAVITARMDEITARRENSQPIREKTGGSTFKNPPGHSSWKLVDEAGWRGKPYGGAMFSPLHSNFLINTGEATAADLEGLGETVRAEVKATTGIELEWEIKRIGRPAA
jgi:UDP-N-acetylmuramate dehydrogenase